MCVAPPWCVCVRHQHEFGFTVYAELLLCPPLPTARTLSLAPKPSRSGATTRKRALSSGSTRRQSYDDVGKPCSSSKVSACSTDSSPGVVGGSSRKKTAWPRSRMEGRWVGWGEVGGVPGCQLCHKERVGGRCSTRARPRSAAQHSGATVATRRILPTSKVEEAPRRVPLAQRLGQRRAVTQRQGQHEREEGSGKKLPLPGEHGGRPPFRRGEKGEGGGRSARLLVRASTLRQSGLWRQLDGSSYGQPRVSRPERGALAALQVPRSSPPAAKRWRSPRWCARCTRRLDRSCSTCLVTQRRDAARLAGRSHFYLSVVASPGRQAVSAAQLSPAWARA